MQEGLDGFELGVGIEEVEFSHDVLPVAPDVVVLGVLFEHLSHEARFCVSEGLCGRGVRGEGREDVVDESLSVSPDLVVLLVLESDFVHPFELFVDWNVEREYSGSSVEPYCVVGCIEGYDVLCEVEDSRGVFFSCHRGAKISHRCIMILAPDPVIDSAGTYLQHTHPYMQFEPMPPRPPLAGWAPHHPTPGYPHTSP